MVLVIVVGVGQELVVESAQNVDSRDASGNWLFNMFSINGPEIISEYYGESEQELRAIFKSD